MLQTVLIIPKNRIFPPHHTLQQWLTPTNKRHIQHEWYHDTRSKELFNNKDTKIIQYFFKEITHYTLQLNMNTKIKTTVIPQSATPTKKRDNKFKYYSQHGLETNPSTVPVTLIRHINSLPE